MQIQILTSVRLGYREWGKTFRMLCIFPREMYLGGGSAVLLSILFKELPFIHRWMKPHLRIKKKPKREISLDKWHWHTSARSVCLLPLCLESVIQWEWAHMLLTGRYQGQLTLRFESGKGPLAPPTYQPVLMQTSYPNTIKYCTGPLVWVCPTGGIYRAHFSARANILLFE